MTALPASAATGDDASKVKAFLRLVVIEHSVFALPFAYLAALIAMGHTKRWFAYAPLNGDRPAVHGTHVDPLTVPFGIHWLDLLLVTVAMVSARTFAMATNRIIDRELDARNPRTAQRELVTGSVAVSTATVGAVIALVVFLASAMLLGRLCLLLAPLAVLPLIVYPYAKRFTNYPQVVLGIAQAVAPVGAWIAITGRWSAHAVVLGFAVGTWIAGFDLVYACQDVESDRAEGVGSVPAKVGIDKALAAARLVHVVTFGLFVWFGQLENLGVFWYVGLAITAAAFVYQHRIVNPGDLSRVNRSFFTTNGFIGIVLFVFGVAALVSRGGLQL